MENPTDPSDRPASESDARPVTDDAPDSARSLLDKVDGLQRRQQRLEASAEIASEMLSGEGPERALDAVTQRVLELCDADGVYIALLNPNAADGVPLPFGGHLIAGHAGLTDVELVALSHDELPFVDLVVSGAPLPPDLLARSPLPDHGPAIGMPLRSPDTTVGAIVAVRLRGRPRFEPEDEPLLAWFADQASIALELAARRNAQREFDVVAERDRIARDLHDHVIQRLFAAGMTLQATAESSTEPAVRQRIEAGVDQLDQTVRQIRTAIFDLHTAHDTAQSSLRRRLLDIVAHGRDQRTPTPSVQFVGPIDTLVPPHLGAEAEAVVREAISNAVRHADASELSITVTTGDRLTIHVHDNGRGIGPAGRRSGLDNLRVRAQRCGGTFEVGPRDGGGTRLVWSVPLDRTPSPA